MQGTGNPYWDCVEGEEFCLPYCPLCQKFVFYPRKLCPNCFKSPLEWKVVPGRGKVYSYTQVRVSALPEFDSITPYVLALIELDVGVKMLSHLVDCPSEKITINMPVEMVFREIAGQKLPVFRPGEGL